MIEINVKLVRKETATYVAGEKLQCFIEVNNITNPTKKYSLEHLAWASVQILCYRSLNFTKYEEDLDLQNINVTSLENINFCEHVESTKAKILFCDLKLKIDEKKKYLFSEFIPRNWPPSYRGFKMNYFYKLVVATQRVKNKVKVVSIPIRVLPVPINAKLEDHISVDTPEDFKRTNPFLDKDEVFELELSWSHLTNLTARRMPKFYKITNKRGFIGRFCLFKNDFKLGEDIIGTIDFEQSDIRCVQFIVKLQREENISYNRKQLNEGLTRENDCNKWSGELPRITNYTNHHEFCFSILQSHIIVPIPLNVSPTFSTEYVNVKWKLHFEFVTCTKNLEDKKENWVGPDSLDVETMVWDLPITIWSTSPLQIWTPPSQFSLHIN